MKIKLGRKETVELLPFTGKTFCGCYFFQGLLFEACKGHSVGKHRGS